MYINVQLDHTFVQLLLSSLFPTKLLFINQPVTQSREDGKDDPPFFVLRSALPLDEILSASHTRSNKQVQTIQVYFLQSQQQIHMNSNF